MVRGLLSERHPKRLGHSTDYTAERCARTARPSGVETTSVTVSHAEDGASLLGADVVFNYDLSGKALLSTLRIRRHRGSERLIHLSEITQTGGGTGTQPQCAQL